MIAHHLTLRTTLRTILSLCFIYIYFILMLKCVKIKEKWDV